MATVTFDEDEDPVAAARAVASALSIWLSEQPKPEAAPPASAKLTYDGDRLHIVVVTLGDEK